ncbi:MAG: hypothetical protein OK442_05050 [Thaumarchaeota archaeon]|nr:hypothetical protein [Nitrososphaerota archaeon]
MAASSSVGLILWNPYSGLAAVLLSVLLLLVGAGLLLSGRRLAGARNVPARGRALKVVTVIVWAFSILLVLPLFGQIERSEGQSSLGIGPVFPVTLACAFCSFFIVAYLTRGSGAIGALANGFAAAVAGPMVFELPFLLIITPVVTTRVPHPLFLFVVFLVVILTTLALPTFSTRFSVTRYSLYSLGAMFVVFAGWALLTGYAPPSDTTSFALNAVSKVLGFAVVVASFSGGAQAARKAVPTPKT